MTTLLSLRLNEEQRMLREAAGVFLAERSPVSAQRRLRDTADPLGFDPALWTEAAGLGWAAAPFSEAAGGLGVGWKSLGAVFEAAGRHLSALPLLSSVVLAGSLVDEVAAPDVREAWLPRLIDGSARLALAVDEQPRHDPHAIACIARAGASGQVGSWVLQGLKRDVLDGVGADGFLIVARLESDGLPAMFLVEAGTPGLEVTATQRLDSRNAARIALQGVQLPVSARLVAAPLTPALERALDRARVMIAAETLGLARAAFEMTVDYLRQRVQFDVPIGSFQALQHRAARLHVGLELLESCVAAGLEALDTEGPDRAALASLAKARAADLGEQLLNEAVQLHGGIGVTDEYDLGLFLKRNRVLAQTLGDAVFHRDRYARLRGF